MTNMQWKNLEEVEVSCKRRWERWMRVGNAWQYQMNFVADLSGFESNNCLFSFCHLQLKISRDSLNIHLHLLKKYLPNAPGFSRESPETDVAQPCLKLVEILSKIEVGIPHTPCLLRHIEILRNSQLTGWEWVWSHTHTELIKVIDSHIFDALPSPPIPSPFFPLPSPFCLLSFLPFLFPYSPSELQ